MDQKDYKLLCTLCLFLFLKKNFVWPVYNELLITLFLNTLAGLNKIF